MQRQPRKFDVVRAVRERTALIISITGGSGTGKSFSACRLATGIQRVLDGKIGYVDTEARRGLHYADMFNIEAYVDFAPPFGPLDYKDAIGQVIDKGSTIVIVDQLTHEHSGEGGVMDQIEKFLDDKCGDDWDKRDRMNMIAHAKVKPQRKTFNNWVTQLGRKGIVLILLYRGRDVIKPMTKAEKDEAKRRGDKPGLVDLGVQPETTSPLIWETTIGFLLKPGADGRPTILSKAETDAEKTIAKTPGQFRSWDLGKQLDEALGEKLARWAMGEQTEGAAQAQGGAAAGSPPQSRPAAARGAAPSSDARTKWVEAWGRKGIDEERVRIAVGAGDLVAMSKVWAEEIKAGRPIEDIFTAPALRAPPSTAAPETPPADEDEKGDAPSDDEWMNRETT